MWQRGWGHAKEAAQACASRVSAGRAAPCRHASWQHTHASRRLESLPLACQAKEGNTPAQPHHILVPAREQVAVAHDGAHASIPVWRGRGAGGQPGGRGVAGGGGVAGVNGLGQAAHVAVIVGVRAAQTGVIGSAKDQQQAQSGGAVRAGEAVCVGLCGGPCSSSFRMLAHSSSPASLQDTPLLVHHHLLKLWPSSCSTAMTSHTTADGLLPCGAAGTAAVQAACCQQVPARFTGVVWRRGMARQTALQGVERAAVRWQTF